MMMVAVIILLCLDDVVLVISIQIFRAQMHIMVGLFITFQSPGDYSAGWSE